MNNVVKIKQHHGGEKIKYPKWCLVDPANFMGRAALCTQAFFGLGESDCIYETKIGKVTCPRCIEIVKIYKSIKL